MQLELLTPPPLCPADPCVCQYLGACMDPPCLLVRSGGPSLGVGRCTVLQIPGEHVPPPPPSSLAASLAFHHGL